MYYVYKLQEHIVNYIKANLPHINNVKYFSDGCAGQYKNFINLYYHIVDFNIAEYFLLQSMQSLLVMTLVAQSKD